MTTCKLAPALLAFCLTAQASGGRSTAFPLGFEPNVGQTASAVTFVARGQNYTQFLTPGEATLPTGTSALKMRFIGADPDAQWVQLDPMESRAHYLIGDAANWHTPGPSPSAPGRLYLELPMLD